MKIPLFSEAQNGEAVPIVLKIKHDDSIIKEKKEDK
jgi:hypothetical protein